jgi:hypothetical protein
MNYVIVFAASAVAALYGFIIQQCLTHPEW